MSKHQESQRSKIESVMPAKLRGWASRRNAGVFAGFAAGALFASIFAMRMSARRRDAKGPELAADEEADAAFPGAAPKEHVAEQAAIH